MGPMPRDTIPLGGSGGQVGNLRTSDRDHVYSVCIYTYLHIYIYIHIDIPVVPHKAVAEVSRIGNV